MAIKKLWILVLLFACLGMMLSSMEIKRAQATTITKTRTFSSQTYDGSIQVMGYEDDGYLLVWNATTGTVSDVSESTELGQALVGSYFILMRYFVFFDTSLIPDGANVTNATLSLRIYQDYSTTDFNVSIQSGQPAHPHMPLETGDYYRIYYDGEGEIWGTRNTGDGISVGAYWNITLIADPDVLNVGGSTKLCLRSNREIAATVPTGNEYIKIYSCEKGSAYAPKLYVTYETEGCHYVVHGPYYENGAVAPTIANVTLYSKTENPYSFVLNGTDGVSDTETLDVEQAGWYFQWNASTTTNKTRSYYLSSVAFDELWIYVADPTKTYLTYTVAFLDLAGVLKSMPYVSVQRYINGMKTIEKQKVDIEKKVVFYLEQWQAYTIVLGDTVTSYTFGDVTFASTDIALTLKAVDFPKATLFTYKYVRVYGERALGTPHGTITITYQDILNMTNLVQILINYKNGTNIVYQMIYTDAFVYTWNSARNDTDYAVVLTIFHQQYGVYQCKQYFSRSFSTAPWGMPWFGTLPFNSAYLIPALLILFSGGIFTVINAYVGAFMMVIVAALLSYMGWIPISGAALVTAFTFAIIMGIIYAKKRIQT